MFEAQVVFLAGGERDDGAVELTGLVAPLVEDELAVEPQARAPAGLDVEGVALGELRGDLPTPPHAERLRGQFGHRRVLAPVEIQLRVNAREGAAAVEFRATVVSSEQALRGRGDAGFRADGGVELVARDDALRDAGAGPRKAQAGGAEVVVVFEAEVVALTSGEVEVAGDFRAVGHAPGVADEFVAEPEARAVVGIEVEGELAGDGGFELPGPAGAEVILLHARDGFAHLPVEVDRLVEAVDGPPAQVHALVVSAEQAVAAALHQRGDRGREGGGRAAGEDGLLDAGERELLLLAVEQGDFDAAGRIELDGAFEELAVARPHGTGVGGERGGAGEEEEECPRMTRMGANGSGDNANHSEGMVTGNGAELNWKFCVRRGRSPSPRPSPAGRGRMLRPPSWSRCAASARTRMNWLPLPAGEGWGEGERVLAPIVVGRARVMSSLPEIRVQLFTHRAVILRLVGAVSAGEVLHGELCPLASLGFESEVLLPPCHDDERRANWQVTWFVGNDVLAVEVGAEGDGLRDGRFHAGRLIPQLRSRSGGLTSWLARPAVRLTPSPQPSPPVGAREWRVGASK